MTNVRCAALVLALLAVLPISHAEAGQDCPQFAPQGVCAELSTTTGPTSGGGSSTDSSGGSDLTWVKYTPATQFGILSVCFVDREGNLLTSPPPSDGPLAPEQIGSPVFWMPVSRSTGLSAGPAVPGCDAPGFPAEAPPAPPSVEEVIDRTPIPQPEVNVNPHRDGLVGLSTWFWGDPVRPVEATVTLRGWTAAVTARPVEYIWRTDGAEYTSPVPGSEEDPAATHVYENRGDYRIEHEVRWAGSFTVTGFGLTLTQPLGTVGPTAAIEYHVIEAQAVGR